MNRKIKELALQANPASREIYESDNWQYNCAAWCAQDVEKFAELIVRECAVPMITQARVMDAHGGYKNNPVEVTAMNLHQGLLKHFGVE